MLENDGRNLMLDSSLWIVSFLECKVTIYSQIFTKDRVSCPLGASFARLGNLLVIHSLSTRILQWIVVLVLLLCLSEVAPTERISGNGLPLCKG